MKSQRRNQAHNSFSYFGAGNMREVFNRKPKPVFQKIRKIYGEQLAGGAGTISKNNHNKFTKEEKVQIQKKVAAIILEQDLKRVNYYTFYFLSALVAVITVIALMSW
ncbi:hypothetical protein [Pseudotenacibaculum haliotis]|uniref:Riboflavin synthase subunit beta n=1 Tax=Pseudotenacibaculum haliotis TaxID=1862138 RepID=A0ABW5LWQ1_9FLAO